MRFEAGRDLLPLLWSLGRCHPPGMSSPSPPAPAAGTLPPTATYTRREWQWLPADCGPYLVDRDGALAIAVSYGRRVIRTEIDHYLVQEERDEPRAGIRSFLLENELDPDPHGPFRCVIGRTFATCGCESGAFDRRRVRGTGCKHRDALRALIQQGCI